MSTASHQSTGFGLSVQAREDGSLEAAYVRLSQRQVARTEELIESSLLLDFDDDGALVGIEVLAPVNVTEVEGLASRLDASQRNAFVNFVRSSAPPGLMRS
jgi:uncharacterized protein YuzE